MCREYVDTLNDSFDIIIMSVCHILLSFLGSISLHLILWCNSDNIIPALVYLFRRKIYKRYTNPNRCFNFLQKFSCILWKTRLTLSCWKLKSTYICDVCRIRILPRTLLFRRAISVWSLPLTNRYFHSIVNFNRKRCSTIKKWFNQYTIPISNPSSGGVVV